MGCSNSYYYRRKRKGEFLRQMRYRECCLLFCFVFTLDIGHVMLPWCPLKSQKTGLLSCPQKNSVLLVAHQKHMWLPKTGIDIYLPSLWATFSKCWPILHEGPFSLVIYPLTISTSSPQGPSFILSLLLAWS